MKMKLAFLLFLVLVGAVSFFGFRGVVGHHGDVAQGRVLTTQEPCELHQGACEATGQAQQRVRVSLAPTPLPLMKTVTTSVEISGFSEVLSARFQVEGVNMFMGYQQAALQPEHPPKDSSPVTLAGEFMLPVCSNEVMHWQGTLYLQTRTGLFRAAFPFTTRQTVPH